MVLTNDYVFLFTMRPTQYFKLWFDDRDPDPVICNEHDLMGADQFFAYTEHPIGAWPGETPTFYYENGAHVQDFLESATNGWELFSERVRQCFLDLRVEGAELLPVRVIHKPTGQELAGYYVLHVCNVVAALDRERAGWDEDPDAPGEVMGVYRFALRSEAIAGVDIFRLKEDDMVVFFSLRLKKAIDSIKATGFLFLPIEAN